MEKSTLKSILSSVVATTTSEAIEVGSVEKITLLLTATSITTGNGVFTVTGSIDGTTYVPIMLIDNVANTNAQTITRVDSSTLSSNSSKIYALDLEQFGYRFIKVTITRTTDGAYSCSGLLEY